MINVISTHGSTKEPTNYTGDATCKVVFQLTAPRRSRQYMYDQTNARVDISTHGSTKEPTLHLPMIPCISLHFNSRLHEGADETGACSPSFYEVFQLTAPRRSRQYWVLKSSVRFYFNSRLHEGADCKLSSMDAVS